MLLCYAILRLWWTKMNISGSRMFKAQFTMWSTVWMKCTVTWTVILAATWRLRMIRDEYWTWWKSDWPFSSTPTILYCSCTAPRLPYSLSMSSVTCNIGDNSLTAVAQIFKPINWQKIYYTTRLHPFNGLFFKDNLEQEMTGWQWHHLDYMQIICT